MKKFIKNILLLLLIIFVIDRIIGSIMQIVINNIEIGGMGRDNYICNKTNEDVFIFGSSRAVHHYNSSIIEDSLRMTCYNCGDDGNGVFLNFGRLLMCKERKLPKVIIFDFVPNFDIKQNDNHKYLGWLKARYNRTGISTIFTDIDEKEKYKMLSYMYRYNTRFLQNILVFLTGKSSDTGIKGYRPLHGQLDSLKINKNHVDKPLVIDSLKFAYINKFIVEAKDSKLFFVYSPRWYGADTINVKPLMELCKKENIPFIDFTTNPKYYHNDIFFKDGAHLNSHGADEFTKDLINILKEEYSISLSSEE